MKSNRKLFRAALIADGTGLLVSPGAILAEPGTILASGSPQAIGGIAADGCETIDLFDAAIIPGLVNAHCHLDLTHLGPQPFTGDFPSWVDLVRNGRALTDHDIAASVQRGVELSRAGGTVMIGDIAGTPMTAPLAAADAFGATGMLGVSFLEMFGQGLSQSRAIERMRSWAELASNRTRGPSLIGLQPHSPYSCGLNVYQAAVDLGLPLATHLGETREEIEFVESASGPLAEMLRYIGVWDDTITATDKHPVDHLLPILQQAPFIAAHLNYVNDEHLAALAQTQTSVAYCPRASAYFGHSAHRYREMLDAGINVALGTDSILCLDTPDRISLLDEVRLLYKRDGTDPRQLLAMATVNGASALGFDPALVTLKEGPSAGFFGLSVHDVGGLSVREILSRAMSSQAQPDPIFSQFFPFLRIDGDSKAATIR